MDRNRVLELALEELRRQKAGIDAEIEKIQTELRTEGKAVRQGKSAASGIARTGTRTAAKRGAQSRRMRQKQASRGKAQASKAVAGQKTPPAAKLRAKTDAEKRALSLKMKEVWRKRRAEAAKASKAASKAVKSKER
jgi:hypothetical protein